MDGYLFKFEVYQEKGDCRIDPAMSKYFGIGKKIIYQMSKSLQGKFHQVFIDNFFTPIPLMEYLLSHQILCCETLQKKKKYLPQDFVKDKCLQRGDFDYRTSKNGIADFKWKDNKPVYAISNYHGIDTSEIKRKNRDGSISIIGGPKAVKDYNTFMGGVDKVNMLCSLYGTFKKSKKWWCCISFGLVD